VEVARALANVAESAEIRQLAGWDGVVATLVGTLREGSAHGQKCAAGGLRVLTTTDENRRALMATDGALAALYGPHCWGGVTVEVRDSNVRWHVGAGVSKGERPVIGAIIPTQDPEARSDPLTLRSILPRERMRFTVRVPEVRSRHFRELVLHAGATGSNGAEQIDAPDRLRRRAILAVLSWNPDLSPASLTVADERFPIAIENVDLPAFSVRHSVLVLPPGTRITTSV
jgi:hypothetical protein